MEHTPVDELLHNLRNFLAAGDENRGYLLNRVEVTMLIEAIERYRPVPFLSFDELRKRAAEEQKARKDKHA